MDWDHLRFVLAIAEAGGLSGAARRLGVDAGTVARRLDAIESALRCRLFHRSRHGLAPTASAAKLLAPAQRIAAEIRGLDLALAAEDRGDSGPVVVTATEAIAAAFLAPLLPRLRARHPGIVVELVTDIRTLDLARREADIALRLTRPTGGDLRARRIGSVGYALYGGHGYLAEVREGGAGARFAGHALIDWPFDYTVIEQVPWLRREAAAARVVLRSGSAVARQAACAAGLGLALLPCLLADGDERIARVKTSTAPPAQELWLVAHRDVARVPRVRAVLEFLALAARGRRRALRRCESIGSAESRHESYQALATLRSSEKSINSQILSGAR
jgi:DNA-binding transcriptional LysR family regulator